MAELGIIGEPEQGARGRKVLIKKGQDPFKESGTAAKTAVSY